MIFLLSIFKLFLVLIHKDRSGIDFLGIEDFYCNYEQLKEVNMKVIKMKIKDLLESLDIFLEFFHPCFCFSVCDHFSSPRSC
jgi:hypothetical protein